MIKDIRKDKLNIIKNKLLKKESNKFVVAVDGFSASGKSYLSKILAHTLDWNFFPTGKMYRYIAHIYKNSPDTLSEMDLVNLVLETRWNIQDIQNIDLNDENIAIIASNIASLPNFRNTMESAQKKLIDSNERSIIVEGRAIGSSLLPNADLKIFVICEENIRTRRRLRELHPDVSPEDQVIRHNINLRDKQDSLRAVSPLIVASDALVLDNSSDDIDYLIDTVLNQIANRI